MSEPLFTVGDFALFIASPADGVATVFTRDIATELARIANAKRDAEIQRLLTRIQELEKECESLRTISKQGG